ncbi:hypothetical protein ONI83_004832 [Escherichia coli]|nr:hypothetical protein [Escherichia coli]
MDLPEKIDLSAIARAQQREMGRQLTCYLQRQCSSVLYCQPADVDALKDFMPPVIQQADRQGYGSDALLTFFIVSSFLLGFNWLQDPAFTPLKMLLAKNNDSHSWLNYCRHERQKLNTLLPTLHDYTHIVLHMPVENVSPNAVLQHWQVICELRGIDALLLPELYFCYEADFRQFSGLPANTAKREQALLHSGLSLETVSDLSKDLTFRQRHQLLTHLHLALSFGRYYRTSPLHKLLHQALDTLEMERVMVLTEFLRMHQQRLKENIKDGV